jgi:membrane protease subunit HflK
MPWSNQGGGWQSGGGNRGGPWGPGPSGPTGRGPTPPDLEELLKRGQDKLKDILPGGGSNRIIAILVAVLLAAVLLSQSFFQVKAEEEGVVLRFGRFVRIVQPGLHFAFWPIETYEKVRVLHDNQSVFGVQGQRSSEGLMLASDQKIVDIKFSVFWKVKDAQGFLFNVDEQEKLVRAVAESAMREVVGRTPSEEVRTTGREKVQVAVFDLTQKTLDDYNSGILIRTIALEGADPPQAVVDAFEEVQRAEQNQTKFIREAEQYRNKILGDARGEAAKIMEDAKGYKAQVTNEALGQSQRFLSVHEEYKKAQDVTRKRIFLETMEDVLKNSNKVIIEQGPGQGVVPYLPLPEIQKAREAAPAPSASAGKGVAQ